MNGKSILMLFLGGILGVVVHGYTTDTLFAKDEPLQVTHTCRPNESVTYQALAQIHRSDTVVVKAGDQEFLFDTVAQKQCMRRAGVDKEGVWACAKL